MAASTKRGSSKAGTPDARLLPRALRTALGAVPVRMVEQPTAGEAKAFGTFDIEDRVIEIKRGMGDAATAQIFLHEAVHIALWDAGAQLTTDQEEQVCTSVATFLLATGLVRFRP